jgi:putative membrane protein
LITYGGDFSHHLFIKLKTAKQMSQNILKGIAAGAIAGLVGAAVKTIWEEIAPVRPEHQDAPSVVLADRAKEETTGDDLKQDEKPLVEQSVQWLAGAGVGALYGAVVEVYPKVPTGTGSVLGMALYGATHGSVLPMLNAEPWPLKQPLKFASSEFSGHVLYGLSVEFTRRIIRNWMEGNTDELLSATD